MREAIITSAVLIVCITLLRKLCKGKISAGLQYALWLIVAIRLIMPGVAALFPQILPESDFSVMRIADRIESSAQDYFEPVELPIQISLTGNYPFLPGIKSEDGPTAVFLAGKLAWGWTDFFRDIWYVGMVVAAIWMIAVNIRFFSRLRKIRKKYDKEDFALPVYLVKGLASPCLYGPPFRQSVYMPEDIIEDDERTRHILAHEYCHYRHGDVIWSLLRCVLVIVYWFDPLVWLAAVLSKQDCELACDEAAIRMLGEEERIAYGKTLISLILRKTKISDIVCTATTMTGGAKAVKERIRRIAQKPRRLVILLIPLFVVIALVVLFTFTKTKEYPEGMTLLESADAQIVTTDCFQVAFPASLAEKVYYLGENDTDIVVYHKDSDREIGRFCRMSYEEAIESAEGQGALLIGDYGANTVLQRYLDGETTQEILHEYSAPDGETQHEYTPADEGYQNFVPAEDSNAIANFVPGTDSNEDTTYIIEDDSLPDEKMRQAQGGGLIPIPAPEEVEVQAEKMPFQEGDNYSAVDVEDSKEDYQPEDIDNEENVGESHTYLPNEVIIVTETPVSADFNLTGSYCYLYLPADNSDADADLQTELSECNENLIAILDSVKILSVSVESIQDIMKTLSENRTAYVGDASKVSKLAASVLTTPELSYQKIELETANEPYSITIHYRSRAGIPAQIDEDTVFLQAALMFASVENLGECRIRIYEMPAAESLQADGNNDDVYEEISYRREDMESLFGALYPCSETPEAFSALYNMVLEYLSGSEAW